MSVAARAALRARLFDVFQHDPDSPLADESFDQLARDIFAFQFAHNATYGGYCERRGVTPDRLEHWSNIPPVPTAAFKEVPLVSGSADTAHLVFRTSGTTRGEEKRGAHHIIDPTVYEAALLPMFAAWLLPDHAQLAFVSLIPTAEQAPDSSLSYMVRTATQRLAAHDGGTYVDLAEGLRAEALTRALADLCARAVPVLLLGTSFAFVHWLDLLSAEGRQLRLPEGSRLMDTGGYKGRSRTVPAPELRAAYGEWLGLPAFACINEYGMTELCSQFYDSNLRDRTCGRTAPEVRVKQPAPWVRTRVVDPETLRPVPAGTTGILQHFDLANLFSVLAVQTEDLGRAQGTGFETLGRATGAQPRGCSVALDLLLESTGSES